MSREPCEQCAAPAVSNGLCAFHASMILDFQGDDGFLVRIADSLATCDVCCDPIDHPGPCPRCTRQMDAELDLTPGYGRRAPR